MQAVEFVRALYPDGLQGENTHLLCWSLPHKRSYWFSTIEDFEKKIDGQTPTDLYIGVGASPGHFGSGLRCPANRICGIPGLVVDVDIEGPAHQKKSLPPTEAAARGLIYGWGLDPTILVHSGHGLQAWWLFHEPWWFDSDEERTQASEMARRLHQAVQERAKGKGWVIDSVHDLSRVMRLPGTLNGKNGQSVPIVVRDFDDSRRYNPSDLDEILPAVAPLETIREPARQITPGQFPWSKHSALCEIDHLFKLAWDKERDDLPSPSEYEMSMANTCAACDWTDEEIAALFVAWRSRHGFPVEKAKRHDYLAMTISKARKAIEKEKVEEVVEEASAVSGTEYQSVEKIRDALCKFLRVDDLRVTKSLESPPHFTISIRQGSHKASAEIGPAEGLSTRKKFANHFMAITKPARIVPDVKKTKATPDGWDKYTLMLLEIADEVENEDGEDVAAVRNWIEDYLDEGPTIEESPEAALSSKSPFRHAGNIYLMLDSFRLWLGARRFVNVTAKELNRKFRRMGITREQMNVEDERSGRRTTIRGWNVTTICE